MDVYICMRLCLCERLERFRHKCLGIFMTITSLFSLSFPDFCLPPMFSFFFSVVFFLLVWKTDEKARTYVHSNVYHAKYNVHCTCVLLYYHNILPSAMCGIKNTHKIRIQKIRSFEHVLNHTKLTRIVADIFGRIQSKIDSNQFKIQ